MSTPGNEPLPAAAQPEGLRCLLTGATGFIGSHAARLLVRRGCKLTVLMRAGGDPWRIRDVLPSIRVLDGDLAHAGDLGAAIKDLGPQVLVHAGWSGVSKDSRDGFEQITRNLYGTLDLVRACLAAGCQTVVGLGSQAEYGPTDARLHEDMPARPDTMYGLAKLCAGLISQHLCAAAGARLAWLRLTAAFGPADSPEHLIPYVIDALLRRDEPALTGGRQKWDYLYVNDVAEAVWSAITHSAAAGTFNLSSGHAVAVREICEMIRDRIDPALALGFGRIASPDGSRTILEADSGRLREATGWQPQTSLAQGLERTIAWHVQPGGLGT